MPTFGSLFSGIGGLDLGLERAGWTCRWQVEIDPFCRAVLARHWPGIRRYGDIADIVDVANTSQLFRNGGNGEPERHLSESRDHRGTERVDLLCGGFPCQPVSVAGKREGQADSRWLWPEFARVIRLLRPSLVLVENVPGLLSANRGDAMGQVLGDLAASGYDAEWDIVSAADVGAPHRRERVWIVAYADEGHGRASGAGEDQAAPAGLPLGASQPDAGESMAHAALHGRQSRRAGDPAQEPGGREPYRSRVFEDAMGYPYLASEDAYTATGRSRGAISESSWWRIEPDVGRVAHGVPARVDRLRSLGNAVVPQVAEWIGRRLMAAL